MVSGIKLLFSLLIGLMWGVLFKMLDPSMTLFQTAVLGFLTAILFQLEGKE